MRNGPMAQVQPEECLGRSTGRLSTLFNLQVMLVAPILLVLRDFPPVAVYPSRCFWDLQQIQAGLGIVLARPCLRNESTGRIRRQRPCENARRVHSTLRSSSILPGNCVCKHWIPFRSMWLSQASCMLSPDTRQQGPHRICDPFSCFLVQVFLAPGWICLEFRLIQSVAFTDKGLEAGY